jgi:carbonic anhydrase/acetyltransferase-like protein (isoleucine patch superfamily)
MIMSLTNNIRPNPAGDAPRIHPDAFIDPSAQIIGNVRIERDVFIGPLCVIRADERGMDGMVQQIIIARDVNIQDGVIMHSHGGSSVTVGPSTSIAHGVIIHGPCSIDEGCFLSMRSTIYSATLEAGVWVGMGAIIMRATLSAHTYVPPGSVIRNNAGAMSMHFVNTKEQRYMEEAMDAARRLRENYLTAERYSGSLVNSNTEKESR